jgi:hypothetical protein
MRSLPGLLLAVLGQPLATLEVHRWQVRASRRRSGPMKPNTSPWPISKETCPKAIRLQKRMLKLWTQSARESYSTVAMDLRAQGLMIDQVSRDPWWIVVPDRHVMCPIRAKSRQPQAAPNGGYARAELGVMVLAAVPRSRPNERGLRLHIYP